MLANNPLRRVSFTVDVNFIVSLAKQIVPEIDQIRFGRVENKTALGLASLGDRDELIRARFATMGFASGTASSERERWSVQAASTSSDQPVAGSGQPASHRQGAFDFADQGNWLPLAR